MNIYTTAHFNRKFKKLTPVLQKKAIQKEKIFISNPFDSRLHTHKLHGKLKEEWSYSVDNSHRIKFVFDDEGEPWRFKTAVVDAPARLSEQEFRNAYGTSDLRFDFNKDGVVNGFDYQLYLDQR